jgi:crotonobetainyl-CoA:carnitine CoA-transferase CaiB-like acyl-CoA transferase
VLDLSRVLAGPLCGMVLADLGAEVVKIEHPGRGDDTRDWGARIGDGDTSYYYSVNRNKQSLALDLDSADGRAIVRRLAAQSDVVIENFRTGGAEKLGVGYGDLNAENPGLVYCSISGYDRSGPEATRPGYDLVIQGEAGLMAMNGEAERPPLKFGIAAVDLFTGMYAAQAIMAVLLERTRTGRGRHVELALFDCGLMITAYCGLEALVLGRDPPRYGNAHPSIVPYGVFDAADGPLVITVGNNQQFGRFCREVIGRPDLADDPRFATNLDRSTHREALLPQIRAELGRRGRVELLATLGRCGIPCGEVLGLLEALQSPRAVDAGLVTRQPHPQAGEAPVLAPPYRFDGQRSEIRARPPQLGEHSDQILRERLGATEAELAAWRAKGAIR